MHSIIYILTNTSIWQGWGNCTCGCRPMSWVDGGRRVWFSFVFLALTLPVLEWQSLPERGFLLDHTLSHRLPLQTAKGKSALMHTNTQRSSILKVTVRLIMSFIFRQTTALCLSVSCSSYLPVFSTTSHFFSVFRLRLPQESTTQISTATAAFVLTFCDHSGLQLSPSPKVSPSPSDL